jgi:hypothetical protein
VRNILGYVAEVFDFRLEAPVPFVLLEEFMLVEKPVCKLIRVYAKEVDDWTYPE